MCESAEPAEQIKDNQRKLWTLGDYSKVAEILAPASVAVADACGIGEGTSVLDVGAGTGNLALEAARRGAEVVASDLTPELLEIAKERARREGLSLQWDVADAEDLPYEDDSFDVVTSVFGAMFAPRADKVVEEMLRVTRPGGVVGFASWANDGYTGATIQLSSEYAPPTPTGFDNAGSWGDEDTAKSRFEKGGAMVHVRSGTVVWDFDSQAAFRDFMETHVPPIVAAKSKMPPAVFEEMMGRYEELQERFNRGSGGRLTIDSKFLIVVAGKPPLNE